jgi:Ca-activated chloride channel family protein
MTFAAPALLSGLALLPLGAASYGISLRARRRYAVRFTNLDLLENVVTGSPRWRRHLPPLLFLLALAALVLAVAQPKIYVHKAKEQATVMLATDQSGSMQATDVRPSRLEAAKSAAKGFVNRLPRQFQLGLVAFNSASQLLVPPTGDRRLVNDTIDTLQAEGGTAIGTAVETSLTGLRPVLDERHGGRKGPPAIVVLLSDGYSTTGPDPIKVANQARKLKVPVNTVALGTEAATVTLADPFGTSRTVRVPPDRATLARIAKITGGKFFDAGDASKLSDVYKSLGTSIGFRREKRDVTAAFAGAGLGLMLLGGAFSLIWFGRLP